MAAWLLSWEAIAQEDLAAPAGSGKLQVAVDFPGGSGIIESIDQRQRSIRLRPSAYENRGWVCWWYVKVSGLNPGETITLDVGDAPWATPDRAAVSSDNRQWRQTARGKREGKRIVYRHQVSGREAWFAWGPPFVPADAEKLVESTAAKCEFASAFELCRTRDDRPVPALRICEGDAGDEGTYGIWIQARQHAWEAGSSWVCRGLVDWLVSADPRAAALRRQAEITIVPIMDIDNTALGAGGKNQHPHDHNRDWSDRPHWHSVAKAIESIKAQDARGRFDLFIDLHNPGADAKNPFFFITPRELLTETGTRNLDRFLAAARQDMTGPLAYVGQTRESGANYDRNWRQISKNWVSLNTRPHVVAVTLETAWNTPNSTTTGYKTVGRQLGQAVERYLRTKPRSD